MLKKLKSFLSKIKDKLYNFIYKIIISIEKHLPLKKNIVFECENDMSDNPRSFYEYLLKQGYNKKHKLVWIVKNVDLCRQKYARKNVVFLSRFNNSYKNQIKLNYYLSTSKWFIFSHPYWFKNWRRKQIVICTTHSVAQLKQAGSQLKEKHICDYVLSCSPFCTWVKKHNFGENATFLEIGQPRLDLMYHKSDCISKLIDNYKGERIIVSMETFKQARSMKDSYDVDSFSINIVRNESEVKFLNKILQNYNCILIVKIHQLQVIDLLNMPKLSNILYITDDELIKKDIQTNELLTCANILLTDYSSVFYDYLILDRPIGFLCGDMEKYSRGFLFDNPLEEMPGQKIYSLDDLNIFLRDAIEGNDDYSRQRKEIKNKCFLFNDDKNCERLLKWMMTGGNQI